MIAPMQVLAAGVAFLAALVHFWRFLDPEHAPGIRLAKRDDSPEGVRRARRQSLAASVLFLCSGIVWSVVAVRRAAEDDEREKAEEAYRQCLLDERYDFSDVGQPRTGFEETPEEQCEHLLPVVITRAGAGWLR